jgi:hypothetical protein
VPSQEIERIELLRGETLVRSFAGSFGSALRETRLTAVLGYLIASAPEFFCDKFGIRGRPQTVCLEARYDSDRSDIKIETTEGCGVIEAKISAVDPHQQVSKYAAQWHVLITPFATAPREARLKSTRYFKWEEVAQFARQFTSSSNFARKFLSRDFLNYLEDHNMIKRPESIEIYAREINSVPTYNLFLKAYAYGCEYEKSSPLPRALYFAPHFGASLANELPQLKQGISYVARINDVRNVESYKEFEAAFRDMRGARWMQALSPVISVMRRDWTWNVKRSIVFLEQPRLAFNPPIKKEKLQAGKGWLSKRTFSFDTLFRAWGC